MAFTPTIRVIMPSRTLVSLCGCLLALSFCFGVPSLGRSATFTWNGSGDNWDTVTPDWTNSSGHSVAWASTASDAYFPGGNSLASGTSYPNVDAPVTVRSMTFYGDSNGDYNGITSSSNADTISLNATPTVISVNSSGAPFEVDVFAVLVGGGGLTKQGDSTLDLYDNNAYTGATTVSQGVLRLSATAALPGGTNAAGGMSNLVINGGIVELDGMNFYRATGAAASQVQWAAAGGFAAYASNQTVNLGGASALLTWGSGSFVPSGQALLLGANDSFATIYFQNPINLGGGTRTIQTAGYPGVQSGVLSGNLSGSGGGLTVTGSGALELTGSDTYTGVTTVSAAILQLGSASALPGGIGNTGGLSALVLTGGGVVDLAYGNFTRSLGAGQGQLAWSGGGGFSASGGSRAVNLGGLSQTVTWGSGNFVPAGSSLVLGSALNDSMVDFQNPINFGGSVRAVQVNSGFATIDVRLSGSLTNGGLTVSGSGTLDLTGSNNYTLATTVNGGGVLRLSNSAALPGGTGTSGGLSNLVITGSSVVELNAGNFSLRAGNRGFASAMAGRGRTQRRGRHVERQHRRRRRRTDLGRQQLRSQRPTAGIRIRLGRSDGRLSKPVESRHVRRGTDHARQQRYGCRRCPDSRSDHGRRRWRADDRRHRHDRVHRVQLIFRINLPRWRCAPPEQSSGTARHEQSRN